MYDQIKAALQAAGVSVYPAAAIVGKCQSPYVVVHDMGTIPQMGSKGLLGRHLHELVCYAPTDQPQELAVLVGKVQAAIRTVPSLRYTGEAQPTGIESAYDALSMSLIYYYSKRLQ